MFSTNSALFDVNVNSNTSNLNTDFYHIDSNRVNRNKYNASSTSQLVCEHGWSIGWGGGGR